MDLIRKTKNWTYRIKKYFKNRNYAEKVKKEKERKYLFNAPKNTNKRKIFDVFLNKKNFSKILSVSKDNYQNYKIIYYLLWIFLLLISIYIIAISPYFKISPSKVIIERLDTITDINIAYKSVEKVYWRSIFFLNKDEIKKMLIWYQKNIDNVKITKLFPNWIKIIINSYQPEFFTQFAWIEKKYIVTSNWVLIYEKNIDKMLYNLEIIDENFIENWFFDYKEWINSKIMEKIIYTRDIFKDVFSNKNIAKFVYFKLENELHIILETWTQIILELNWDIIKQLTMLKFYNDNYKDILSSWDLRYVDIRIFGKIYACWDKNLCEKNLKRIYSEYYKKKTIEE